MKSAMIGAVVAALMSITQGANAQNARGAPNDVTYNNLSVTECLRVFGLSGAAHTCYGVSAQVVGTLNCKIRANCVTNDPDVLTWSEVTAHNKLLIAVHNCDGTLKVGGC